MFILLIIILTDEIKLKSRIILILCSINKILTDQIKLKKENTFHLFSFNIKVLYDGFLNCTDYFFCMTNRMRVQFTFYILAQYDSRGGEGRTQLENRLQGLEFFYTLVNLI